jgi:glutathione S-transferase
MAIVLYELAGRDDRRFSPNCWRTRMALAHKGLDWEARPIRFIEIGRIAGGGLRTVPVIEDGEAVIGDSWAIAQYLEDTYPDLPSLFGGPTDRALIHFVQSWVTVVLNPLLFGLLVLDIHDHLTPEDQGYFRATREKRLGQTLEDTRAGRQERIEELRASMQTVRLTLAAGPYLAGEAPSYADHLVFASLQWARLLSPLPLLAGDDPVLGWFERCLDLYGGLGRRMPGYWCP